MTTRWPQDQQDQRSGYAAYDESWNQDSDGGQSGQDAGWQDSDGGYGGQWSGGSARRGTAVAQAVADPWAPARSDDSSAGPAPRTSGRRPAGQFQQDWDQGAGGFGDDADYEWFSYLSGGRSEPARPEADPRSGPGRSRDKRRDRGRDPDADRDQPARRGLRGRRGHDRPAPPDPGRRPAPGSGAPADSADPGRPAPAEPGRRRHGRPAPADHDRPADLTDPGWSAPPDPGRRRHGRPAPADPGPLGPEAAAPSGAIDPAISWPGYGQATTDPRLDRPSGRHAPPAWPDHPSWPGVPAQPDPAAGQRYSPPGLPGWPDPAGLSRGGHGPEPHLGYAEPEAVGWPGGTGSQRSASADAPGWPEISDIRGYAPDWSAEPPGLPGWPDPAGLTRTGHGPAVLDDHLGYAEPEAVGWPAVTDDQPRQSADAPGWPAVPVVTDDRLATDDRPYAPSDATGTRARPAPGQKRSGRKPAKPPRGKQARGRQPAATLMAPVQEAPAQPVTKPQPAKAPARRRHARRGKQIVALAGATAVVAGGVVIFMNRSSGDEGVKHVLTAPEDVGAYVKQPQLASQMHAAALREQILRESAGGASNVIYAVYQDNTGPAAAAGPQIVLFIGGNLTGTSGGGFISTFTSRLPGAQTTDPGPLGGAAACAPSVDGRLAECVWADNDTFGVVASQTLSTQALAAQMRQMRPEIEHRAGT